MNTTRSLYSFLWLEPWCFHSWAWQICKIVFSILSSIGSDFLSYSWWIAYDRKLDVSQSKRSGGKVTVRSANWIFARNTELRSTTEPDRPTWVRAFAKIGGRLVFAGIMSLRGSRHSCCCVIGFAIHPCRETIRPSAAWFTVSSGTSSWRTRSSRAGGKIRRCPTALFSYQTCTRVTYWGVSTRGSAWEKNLEGTCSYLAM